MIRRIASTIVVGVVAAGVVACAGIQTALGPKDGAGNLLIDKPVKVFVMGKGKGWGQEVPDNLKTGAWVYAAYGPDGQPLKARFAECRACHVPLARNDFVRRDDEYSEKRAGHSVFFPACQWTPT